MLIELIEKMRVDPRRKLRLPVTFYFNYASKQSIAWLAEHGRDTAKARGSEKGICDGAWAPNAPALHAVPARQGRVAFAKGCWREEAGKGAGNDAVQAWRECLAAPGCTEAAQQSQFAAVRSSIAQGLLNVLAVREGAEREMETIVPALHPGRP